VSFRSLRVFGSGHKNESQGLMITFGLIHTGQKIFIICIQRLSFVLGVVYFTENKKVA
jgi:hypothetical protein